MLTGFLHILYLNAVTTHRWSRCSYFAFNQGIYLLLNNILLLFHNFLGKKKSFVCYLYDPLKVDERRNNQINVLIRIFGRKK